MNAVALYQESQGTPPLWLRQAVHNVLTRTSAYDKLDNQQRKLLAKAMLQVSSLAAKLIEEENTAQHQLEQANASRRSPVLSRAQSAQVDESARQIGSVTRSVLNAVSFPRFVTDLVNGVFRAMLDSTSHQMQMYVELLNNVSASLSGFSESQYSMQQVRSWLVEHFTDAFEFEGSGENDPDFAEDDEEEPAEIKIVLRSGAQMPSEERLRTVFGMEPNEPINADSPEQLVPFARRQIARQRQQMLATMVRLGMQRIVIDSGRIHASMRFHIDTRSALAEDRGTQFGMQNRVRAAGRFGVGPWGVSAEVENNISFVSTQRSQRTEEMNTDLELNSSVDLNFRTDYLPLNQMAASAQADRIRNASLNPEADGAAVIQARQQRLQAQQTAEQQRASRVNLTPPQMATTPLTPPEPQPSGDTAAANQGQTNPAPANQAQPSPAPNNQEQTNPAPANQAQANQGQTTSAPANQAQATQGQPSPAPANQGQAN